MYSHGSLTNKNEILKKKKQNEQVETLKLYERNLFSLTAMKISYTHARPRTDSRLCCRACEKFVRAYAKCNCDIMHCIRLLK